MNYDARISGHGDAYVLEGDVAPSRRKWWILAAVAVVVIGAIAAFMLTRGAPAVDPQGGGRQVPTVSVIVPGRSAVSNVITGTGTIAARREMPVGVAGEGGMVTRVLVEPGSWVGKGQVLATVDRAVQTQTNAQLAAQVNVAKADARLAQADLERAQKLVDRGFVSRADIDRRVATRDAAVARVRVAEASLGESQARTGRLDIRAPEAGLVLTRNVEPGQVVSAGSGVLFRMAKGGEMEMLARMSESDLAKVGVGATATVTPVGDTRAFEGQVWQVSPVIDANTRQGIARVALSYDQALRPGGFASSSIVAGSREAPMLPESAVLSDDKGNFVYVVGKDNKVERRPVKTGTVTATGIAIVEGLSGNEQVVLRAGGFLNPGDVVKAQRTNVNG